MSRGKWKSTIIREAVEKAVLEAEAIKLATLKMEQKVHAKKSLGDSAREHLGKLIDRMDPSDIVIFAGCFAKYAALDLHPPQYAIIEAAIDLGMIKSHTEAGLVAVIAHLGLTEMPNAINLIDKATGGSGTAWEDAVGVLTGQKEPKAWNEFWAQIFATGKTTTAHGFGTEPYQGGHGGVR